MSKFVFLVVVIAAIATRINADSDSDDSNSGLFPDGLPSFPLPPIPPLKALTPEDIKNLAPADENTVVSGASFSQSSSSRTVNGVPVEQSSSADYITNNNGKVDEVVYSS
ncbi:hypothetical protein ACJJTC_015483 [Scirpophaga incertulas]